MRLIELTITLDERFLHLLMSGDGHVYADWNFVKRFPFVSVLTAIRQRHVVRIALQTYLLVTYIRFPLI